MRLFLSDKNKKKITPSYKVKSAFFGVAVGDALGVPVEFKSRKLFVKILLQI
jgi:ADP-ribosylglycohydrolase